MPKHQETFFGHEMRRETLEHLVTTIQFKKMINGLKKWLAAG